jgi:AcrR family transcriptional regulator
MVHGNSLAGLRDAGRAAPTRIDSVIPANDWWSVKIFFEGFQLHFRWQARAGRRPLFNAPIPVQARRTVPTKPRTKPPQERREDLMNAAERLFLDQGVASTTIEQITAAAGVAKGSFYLHFSSKEDVVGGLRQRFVATLLDTIKAAVERRADGDWSGKLAAWATACGRGYAASARLHEIVFHDVPPPSLDGLADNILIDDLTRLLADGDQEEAWTIADARFTAVFLFNALHGVGLDAAQTGRLDVIESRIVEHCFRLVGLPAPAVSAADDSGI